MGKWRRAGGAGERILSSVSRGLTFTYLPGAPGEALVGMREPATGLVAEMRELLPAGRRHLLEPEQAPSSKL